MAEIANLVAALGYEGVGRLSTEGEVWRHRDQGMGKVGGVMMDGSNET